MSLKIAVIIDTWFPHVGGGQINAYEISRILAKNGQVIEIITRNCGSDDLPKSVNLTITKLGGKTDPHSLVSKVVFLFQSFAYVLTRDYDLISAHAFLPGIESRLLGLFKRIPTVLTVHGTSIGTNLNNSILQFLEKIILTKIRYSAEISVSRDFEKFPNVNKKIFYVPNAVKIESFDKFSTTKGTSPTLLFVGRLHRQKNILTLIRALKQVKKDMVGVQLLIVGAGQQEATIINEIKNAHLEKNVKLLGEVFGRNLIKIYKSSELFVLPSLYEGQSLAILEAWAAKIPVVTTKTGDSNYLIENNKNGYFLNNPQDDHELAEIITKALKNKNLKGMGVNGYNLVKKNFSWEKSATLTLEVFEKLIKR